MKKTLIALAVLSAAGVASAQSNVSLSGKFAAAYTSTSTAGVAGSGLGVTDGNVTFAASEDLGGGMKAGVSMDVRVRGRAAAGSVDGRDGTVFVSGGFGTLTLGAIELGNGIIGLGGADAPTQGLDGAAAPVGTIGTAIDDVVNVDILSYTSNAFAGGFTVNAALIDSIGAPGGNGAQDTATTQDATLLGLGYAAGPLAVSADYTTFGFNSVTNTAALDKRIRLSASYDLGVAKLGAGYQTLTTQNVTAGVAAAAGAIDDKQYILGVSAPVGSSTVVGVNYTRHTNNVALSNDITGWDFGVQYNLSKRTNVQFGYRRVAEATVANDNTSTRIRLMHSF